MPFNSRIFVPRPDVYIPLNVCHDNCYAVHVRYLGHVGGEGFPEFVLELYPAEVYNHPLIGSSLRDLDFFEIATDPDFNGTPFEGVMMNLNLCAIQSHRAALDFKAMCRHGGGFLFFIRMDEVRDPPDAWRRVHVVRHSGPPRVVNVIYDSDNE